MSHPSPAKPVEPAPVSAAVLRFPSEGQWQSLMPFASHAWQHDGLTFHYLDEGPTPSHDPSRQVTLLFVHGNPTWSFYWRAMVNDLRGRARCVAIDQAGCGRSTQPAQPLRFVDRVRHLTSFIRDLNLRNIVLVAHDWGGAIGLAAVCQCEERLAGVCLLNTGAFPPPFFPWRIRMCRTPLLGRLAVQRGNAFVRAALRMTLARTKLSPEVAAAYVAPFANWQRRRTVYDFVADIPHRTSHPTWQPLEKLERHLPTLGTRPISLVWGLRDWCFRPECLERLRGIWPAAHVRELPDVGHWVTEDAPEEVNEELHALLDRVEATA